MKQVEFILPTFRYGIHLITADVLSGIGILPQTGVLHLFTKHTSTGLLISEASSVTAYELKKFFSDLVVSQKNAETKFTFSQTKKENEVEEKESIPQIKASLVGQSLTIPITEGKLNLSSRQGIYLCEFKHFIGKRKIVATIIS